jgi:LacI family transcriptional regulator
MSGKRNSTMKDVARVAGVSLGTVSKVINGIPVTDEYKKRVNEAVRSLNYNVNAYARGLKTKKTGIIVVIVPNLSNPFFATLVDRIEYSLNQHGLRLLLSCAEGIPEREVECLKLASSNKADGVIALTYSDVGKYITEDMAIVTFDRYFENRNIPRVASDNFNGACIAIDKLIEFGCNHPVYMRFYSPFPGESDRRFDAYLYCCKKYAIEPDYLNHENTGNERNLMKNFLDTHKTKNGSLTFDGVFAHTDYHACMFIDLLKEEGFHVPDDVQVIGFDGIRKFGVPNGSLFVSSIVQPVDLLAEKCVELVTAENRAAIPSLTLLPPHYEYGGTTRDPNASIPVSAS